MDKLDNLITKKVKDLKVFDINEVVLKITLKDILKALARKYGENILKCNREILEKIIVYEIERVFLIYNLINEEA